jgi:hypothetical protein
MIIKSKRRGGFKQFSDYLQGKAGNENENEQVNFISSNFEVQTINDWCMSTSKIAAPRRRGKHALEQPIEHISIRTRKGDILTSEAIQGKVPELLKRLGYQDCPWLLVQHVKDGEPHYHLGILRIDPNGKVPNPKSKEICFELAQKFAVELGFKASFDQANGDRHVQQKARLARLWAETEKLSPSERLRKFQKGGFTPARGDRGQLVFVDRYGKPHSLYRIPALKTQGLKQADFPAAFGLDAKSMAKLPTVQTARKNIRRIHNVRRTTNKLIRSFGKVGRIYKNPLSPLRSWSHMGTRRGTADFALLAVLWSLSRSAQRDELRSLRRPIDRKLAQSTDFRPAAKRIHAGKGWWVDGRADGVFKSMLAAGASLEEAQAAVDHVYLEEEQRIAAEQRYLDWLRGPTPKRNDASPESQRPELRT